MVIDEEEEECGWAWGMDPIGSLKGFEGLKRIQAAGIVLLPDADDPDDEGNGETEDPEDDAHGSDGHDTLPKQSSPTAFSSILPPSLHNLSITSLSPSTERHILSFCLSLPTIKTSLFPNLRHVIDLSGEWGDGSSGEMRQEDKDAFYDALDEAGVVWEQYDRPQVGHGMWEREVRWRECMGDLCRNGMHI